MKIIGRSDIVNFPNIGVSFVSAKIDTGAFTSSLHCESVEEVDERLIVDFGEGNIQEIEKYEKINITSSNGHTQERFAITTEIELFGELMSIKLTLANRSTMKNECLIGRAFLSHYKILVYVREQNLSIKDIKPFFENITDLSLYVDGDEYPMRDIFELFEFISRLLYAGQKKITDFGRTSYAKKMKNKHIINNGKKITLDKFITFVNLDEKNERWYMDGQNDFIIEEETEKTK